MSASIWALVTPPSARTAVPSSARVPAAGGVTIFTLASVSPASSSANSKSSTVKVYGLSSPVVTVLWAAVGGLLAAAMSLTTMSVPSVRETPELSQTLLRVVMVSASARTREVLPTTSVRAAVAVVMSASTVSSKFPPERTKSRVMV